MWNECSVDRSGCGPWEPSASGMPLAREQVPQGDAMCTPATKTLSSTRCCCMFSSCMKNIVCVPLVLRPLSPTQAIHKRINISLRLSKTPFHVIFRFLWTFCWVFRLLDELLPVWVRHCHLQAVVATTTSPHALFEDVVNWASFGVALDALSSLH